MALRLKKQEMDAVLTEEKPDQVRNLRSSYLKVLVFVQQTNAEFVSFVLVTYPTPPPGRSEYSHGDFFSKCAEMHDLDCRDRQPDGMRWTTRRGFAVHRARDIRSTSRGCDYHRNGPPTRRRWRRIHYQEVNATAFRTVYARSTGDASIACHYATHSSDFQRNIPGRET